MYYLADSFGELTRLGSSADVLRYYRFASEVLIHDHKVKATIKEHIPLIEYDDDDDLPFPVDSPHVFEKWG